MGSEDNEIRTAILDSAERLFARDGLRATRTEAIAENASVSKALIYYYFDTKQALYAAVLERIRRDRESGLDYAALEKMEPREALVQHLTRLLQQTAEKPHRAPLFALENIQNDGRFYAGPAASMLVLVTILERGMRSRAFRSVDPRHAALNHHGCMPALLQRDEERAHDVASIKERSRTAARAYRKRT